MNDNYKKFADKFSEDGELEFYAKIEKMKKNLEHITNPEIKQNIETNIASMISSYQNMKKDYFGCIESEKKIKETNNLNDKLAIEVFNQKMKYIQKTGFMFQDDFDKEFPFPKN